MVHSGEEWTAESGIEYYAFMSIQVKGIVFLTGIVYFSVDRECYVYFCRVFRINFEYLTRNGFDVVHAFFQRKFFSCPVVVKFKTGFCC